jgi:hypothetical protein
MEVIVNMSVMVIVIAVSGSMLISGMNIFFRNAETLQQKNISDAVSDIIADNLMYASSVSSYPPEEYDGNITAFSLSDNSQLMIKYNDSETLVNAFGDEFYNMYNIGYSVEFYNNNRTAVVISEVYNEYGETVYTSEKSVILINNPDVNSSFYENNSIYIVYP